MGSTGCGHLRSKMTNVEVGSQAIAGDWSSRRKGSEINKWELFFRVPELWKRSNFTFLTLRTRNFHARNSANGSAELYKRSQLLRQSSPCPCPQQFLSCCFWGTTSLLEVFLPLWNFLNLICLILAPAWDHPQDIVRVAGSWARNEADLVLVSYPGLCKAKIYKNISLCLNFPKYKWGKQLDRGILKIKMNKQP